MTKTGNLVGVGVYGIRRTSPFKVFSPVYTMVVLKPPGPTKRKETKAKQFILFLEMFLITETEE
jgi:hypothetical protein